MRDRIHHWKRPAFIAGLCLVCIPVYSQFDTPSGGGRKVILAGGVVAGYLADPAGGPTDAMADAQVAVPQGLLTLEGNPAHAALIGRWECDFSDPTLDRDDQHFTFRAGRTLPGIVTLAGGVRTQKGPYGRDWSATLTAGRRFKSWLAAGASIKSVWTAVADHEDAAGIAWDAGILLLPGVLSRTGNPEDGLRIGASLVNQRINGFEREMVYTVDESVHTDMVHSDLPLVFRIGLSVTPVASETNRITLAADAVHPNDDYESIHLGAEDRFRVRRHLELAVRAGMRFIEGEGYASAGLGACWTGAGGRRFEAGYSWMNEPLGPDRHGIYMRLFR